MKKTETQIKNQLPDTVIDLSKVYILNGDTLELQTTEPPFDADENQTSPVAKKFKSKKEFEEIILQNGKVLFGDTTLLIETRVKTGIEFSGTYIPDAILFDFKDMGKPKCYLIETMLSKQDFYGHLFTRMTEFFKQISNKDLQTSFIEPICKIVNKNYHFKKKLKSFIGEEEVPEFINRVLTGKPPVLLITDDTIQELPEIMQVYIDTWGRLIKPIVLRKFSINRQTLCTIYPDFADIDKGTDKVKEKVLKSTEEDHLKDVSDVILDIYSQIKTELMKADELVQFNPKQYYISIRKNKNLAFMSIGRKRISLVVVNPEAETRKNIKHHEIKTLTEKVQKFWNGPSCTIIIDNAEKLNEVINLLKKLIAKS
ncbi:MAG: DUF5655 domain-containing protein [Minisyncoccia bacterium]